MPVLADPSERWISGISASRGSRQLSGSDSATLVNSGFEKNLTPALIVDFRSEFLERRKRFAEALASALPNTTAERLLPLTLHIFVHVPGLWPFCYPTPASKKMLEDPTLLISTLILMWKCRASCA